MPSGTYIRTLEFRKKLSNIAKGKIPWNKGKKGFKHSEERKRKIKESMMGKNIGKSHSVSEETKKKMSKASSGRIHTQEARKKISISRLGKKHPMYGKHHSEEAKKRIGKAQEKDNNHFWRGGKSFEPYGLEFNNKLKNQIRERDKYQCRECGLHQELLGYKLHIHHIDYNKRNNNMKNLISLCRSCHTQTGFKRNDWTNYYKGKINGLYRRCRNYHRRLGHASNIEA